MRTNETYGAPPKLKWLPLDLLQIDQRYQREIKRDGWKMVRKIANGFQWARFQALIVSGPDKIGDFAVIDGQHRLEAARLLEDVSEVPCLVIDAEDIQRQARTFKGINKDRKRVTRVNVFWADVAAGEEGANKVVAVCRDCGVTISRAGTGRQKPLHTVAVAAIERLIRLDEGSLRRALAILVKSQAEAENAFRAQTIRALTYMIALKPDFDEGRMARALEDMDLDDKIAAARSYVKTLGGSVDTALQLILTRAYNKGLSEANRVPEPRG